MRLMGRAALIVGSGVLLSRLLGLARDVVFASVLGADRFTDEYQVAFIIPDFLNYLLAGGYLAITFIPILSRYLADGDEPGGWRAFWTIAKPITVVMTGLVIVAMAVAEPVIDAVVPGLEPDQVARAAEMTRIVLPAQVFFVIGSLLMGVQYAKHRFLIPTLAPILYNLFIIAGGVLLNLGSRATPEGFAWGVLAGAIVGNFAVQLWGARRAGLRWMPSAGGREPVLREYLGLALPLMIGQSLVLVDELLGRSFGSLVDSDGAISWLQYARRTMLVPVGIIAQAAGVAAYPFLARLVAEGRHREMAAAVGKALRYVVVLSVAAAGGLIALSVPIIRLLYERNAWTAEDTAATAAALVFFALAVPMWGAQQIYARAFYARRDMWTPVVLGTAATIVAVPTYWGFQRWWGVNGLAGASTVALALYTLALAGSWYRTSTRTELGPVLRSGLRALPLVIVGGFAAWAAAGAAASIGGDGSLGALLAVVIGMAAFAATVVLGGGALVDFRELKPGGRRP